MALAQPRTGYPVTSAHGDASSSTYSFTFAAAAISSRVELQELPAGTELQEITIINDALGAGVTLSIGELYRSAADGTTSATSLKAATAAASAGRIDANFHPRILTAPMQPTITVGGAAATGAISAIVKYRYIGLGD